MIILGVDFGDSRTGLAKADTAYPLAQPMPTIEDTYDARVAESVAHTADECGAQLIVIGLPLNMDASEGMRAQKTRAFGAMVALHTRARIVFFDERLTSAMAHSIMNATDTRGKKRKDRVDAAAAVIILQNYLDANRSSLCGS